MGNIAKLNFLIVGVGAALLGGCANKPDPMALYKADMAACVATPPPTDEEILKMSTTELYRWYKLGQRASDQRATAEVLNLPIDPCVKALRVRLRMPLMGNSSE